MLILTVKLSHFRYAPNLQSATIGFCGTAINLPLEVSTYNVADVPSNGKELLLYAVKMAMERLSPDCTAALGSALVSCKELRSPLRIEADHWNYSDVQSDELDTLMKQLTALSTL